MIDYRRYFEYVVSESTYPLYTSECIDWVTANYSKSYVKEIYSITQEKIDKAYSYYKDDFDVYSEEEVKEAIRALMVEWTETQVAPKIESGYTRHSLITGITDEEHARYSLRNILNGSGI